MIAAILAAALTASPTQTLPLQTGDVHCDEVVVQDASIRAGKLSKLIELPPARQELAVNRMIGRCSVPVIVMRNVEAPRATPLKREGAPSHRR